MYEEDWPHGADAELQYWLRAKLLKLLRAHPQGLSNAEAYDLLKREDDAPKPWRDGPVLDWRYACVKRALRDLAEPRWILDPALARALPTPKFTKVTMRKERRSGGEWVLRGHAPDGTVTTYHTDAEDDAVGTKAAMERETSRLRVSAAPTLPRLLAALELVLIPVPGPWHLDHFALRRVDGAELAPGTKEVVVAGVVSVILETLQRLHLVDP